MISRGILSRSNARYERWGGTGTHARFSPNPSLSHKAGLSNVWKDLDKYSPRRFSATTLKYVKDPFTKYAPNFYQAGYQMLLGMAPPKNRMPKNIKPEFTMRFSRSGARYGHNGTQPLIFRMNRTRSHPQYAQSNVDGGKAPSNAYRTLSPLSQRATVYTNPYDTGYDYSIAGASPIDMLMSHVEPADGSLTPFDDREVAAALETLKAAGGATVEDCALRDDHWWGGLRVRPAVLHSIRFLIGEVYAQHLTRVKWVRLAARGLPFSPMGGGERVYACPPPRAALDQSAVRQIHDLSQPIVGDGELHPSSIVRNFHPRVIGASWDALSKDSADHPRDDVNTDELLQREWPYLSTRHVA